MSFVEDEQGVDREEPGMIWPHLTADPVALE